jgi:hypothetical protein
MNVINLLVAKVDPNVKKKIQKNQGRGYDFEWTPVGTWVREGRHLNIME